MLDIKHVNGLADIKDGDDLLVHGKVDGIMTTEFHKNITLKISDSDGYEAILKNKGNIYFNIGMFLKNKSWVKFVLIIRS